MRSRPGRSPLFVTESSQLATIPKRRRFLVPPFIHNQLIEFRAVGFRAYIKGAGKWIFALVVVFYLVRDVTLYILIPYLVLNGIISCPAGSPA